MFTPMKFIADLHIHSRYSRATSRSLDPENLSLWAQKKGITVVGTGDFTHPAWVAELEEKLDPAEEGLFRLKPDIQKTVNTQVPHSCLGDTRFLLSGEISCIYKKNGKTRKVHHLILMPDMASVRRLNERLDRIGNIKSDGRPILGLDSRDLLEITLEADDRAFFIPAHVWTPWFSVFGSKSGFDTLEECFEELTGHIHALETGLSSDPLMNRTLSMLDAYTLVSNSDAHSPSKLGREANLFDTEISYPHMTQAMTDGTGFDGTIEFYPEEGKYHMDGHRKCQVRFEPSETHAHDSLCPVCNKPLTVGVLNRVDELADRKKPKLSKEFFSLVPLTEVLAQLLECGPATKKVSAVYEKLLAEMGPELPLLMDVPLEKIEASGGLLLKEAIYRMRTGKVIRLGGYDGEFGIIRMFEDSEKSALAGQMTLFSHQAKEISKSASPKPRVKKKPEPKKTVPEPRITQFLDPLLDPLNRAQKEVVCYGSGHLMVKAGPGTGKTLTLTHRMAWLIREKQAGPDQILGLTFTRKAAAEMKARVQFLTAGSRVCIQTFHGFCLDLIRVHGVRIGVEDYSLLSEMDREPMAWSCLKQFGRSRQDLHRFIKILPKLKIAEALKSDEIIFDGDQKEQFASYQQILRERKMLDFDDLEVLALKLIQSHETVSKAIAEKFRWIFVDEYQDTSPIQTAILKSLLSAGSINLCVIGDPDQAIYGFRGADVTSFQAFTTVFGHGRVIRLGHNYRSTDAILKGASEVLKKPQPLKGVSVDRSPLFFSTCRTDGEEAEMVVEQIERLLGGTSSFSMNSGRVACFEQDLGFSLSDMGVLYRLNAQGDALEKALDRAGLPFVRSGEIPLVQQYPVNILWRFLQRCLYPQDAFYCDIYRSLLKQNGLNPSGEVPLRITGESQLEFMDRAVIYHGMDLSEDDVQALNRLKQSAKDFKGHMKGFVDYLSLERGIDHDGLLGDRIALMSIHGAKGLEWPVVFLTGCEDRLLPCTLFGDRDDGEEKRLFYVAMTRAQKRLYLSHAKRRVIKGRHLEMNPSPFLKAISKDILKPLDRRGWKPKRKQEQLSLFSSS